MLGLRTSGRYQILFSSNEQLLFTLREGLDPSKLPSSNTSADEFRERYPAVRLYLLSAPEVFFLSSRLWFNRVLPWLPLSSVTPCCGRLFLLEHLLLLVIVRFTRAPFFSI